MHLIATLVTINLLSKALTVSIQPTAQVQLEKWL